MYQIVIVHKMCHNSLKHSVQAFFLYQLSSNIYLSKRKGVGMETFYYHFNSCSSAFVICSLNVYNILVSNTNIEIIAFTCIFTMVSVLLKLSILLVLLHFCPNNFYQIQGMK